MHFSQRTRPHEHVPRDPTARRWLSDLFDSSRAQAMRPKGKFPPIRDSAFQVNYAKRCAEPRKRTLLTGGTPLGGRCNIDASRILDARTTGTRVNSPCHRGSHQPIQGPAQAVPELCGLTRSATTSLASASARSLKSTLTLGPRLTASLRESKGQARSTRRQPAGRCGSPCGILQTRVPASTSSYLSRNGSLRHSSAINYALLS